MGVKTEQMEIERNSPAATVLQPVKIRRSARARASQAQHLERASRVLFGRLPELLARMVGSSQEPGQVTFVFRLGYFDMAGLSQARREFFQETGTGMRIMVEVPDPVPAPDKRTARLKVTPGNLKRLARRQAPVVRTERLERGSTTSSAGLVQVHTFKIGGAPRPEVSPLLRNLSAVVPQQEANRKLEGRPVGPASARNWLNLKLKQKKRTRPQQGPNWLRRREEQIWREPRVIGPGATQRAHSAERQPHCLCPGCGREMESTLFYCPECTLRAARPFKIPSTPGRSLVWLLSQAVSGR